MGAFLGTLFTSLFAFFGQYLTKRIAIIGAVIVAIGTAVAAFTAEINSLFSSIDMMVPSVAAVGVSMLPSNFAFCVSTVISCELAAWTYGWLVKFAFIKSQ